MPNAVSMVNEDRLFSLVKYFFDKPSRVLYELAQNAHRARAGRLDITLKDRLLTVSDDGSGIDDARAVLALAESSWDNEVMATQPAGWGLFFLLCLTERVCLQSRFGELVVYSDRFLNDSSYRTTILEGVNPLSSIDRGFWITATLKEGVEGEILSDGGRLSLFDLDISINGKLIKREDVRDLFSYDIEADYQGNKVYIRLGSRFPGNMKSFKEDLALVWYGIPVKWFWRRWNWQRTREPWFAEGYVAMDVRTGYPLDPVLPYRTDVQLNEKLVVLWNFVRKTVADYCTGIINSSSSERERVLDAMLTIRNVATQDELDALNRYYYDIEDPFSLELPIREVVEQTDGKLFSTEISTVQVVSGTDVVEYDIWAEERGLVLPSGLMRTIRKPRPAPGWLSVIEDEKIVRVELEGSAETGEFSWEKAISIRMDDKELPAMCLVDDYGQINVYYAGDPRDIYDMMEFLFDRHLFNEEGDSWESQHFEFEKRLDEDIMMLRRVYSLMELFAGLRLAEIKPEEVKSLAVFENSVKVELKGGHERDIAVY